MTLSEKSAYLKGLMDGLKLDQETNEGKMIASIVDLLQDMTASISDLEENAIAVSDELDEIEEDLDAIEEFLMDEDDDDDEYDEDEDDYDFADDDGEDFDYEDEVVYIVTCPSCGKELELDEETILND
ncbi:MAG: zinc ribbon domain-containing protein, partial [Clostridiales bacterium]|nr:zinc ribbon domain-containing protein [Clostridiales bacterium]